MYSKQETENLILSAQNGNNQASEKLIIENRQKLDRIAEELMNKTTLIHSDIQEIMHE